MRPASTPEAGGGSRSFPSSGTVRVGDLQGSPRILGLIGVFVLISSLIGVAFQLFVLRGPFSWTVALLGAATVAAMFFLMLLWAFWTSPFWSSATLSPEGVRLRGIRRVQFVPWAAVRGLQREPSFPGRPNAHVWGLSWQVDDSDAMVSFLTDRPAVAILQYPSPPRPSTIRSTMNARSAERGNPAAEEWVQAHTPIFRWLTGAWIAQFLVLVALQQTTRGPFVPMISWSLVAVSIGIVTCIALFRSHHRRIGGGFPQAVEIGSGGVTGIYTLHDRKERSGRRVSRTISFGNIVRLEPWRDPSGLSHPPAPAAVIGTFDPDPAQSGVVIVPVKRDREATGAEPHDILYLARENYDPVRAAWEGWKSGMAYAGSGLNTVAASSWMATSELYRTGPVRLPPPSGG